MALPTTPTEWLGLAEEMRAEAEQRHTPDARATMRKVADQYEQIAAYMASFTGDD